MFAGERGKQACAAIRAFALVIRQPPAAGEVIAQLADQHRRRLHAVVDDAAPDPRHRQVLARRQQRFEEQVAVVLAARAVAGAIVLRHEVEIRRTLAARVGVVAHAEQIDATERDRPHRHQRGEQHGAGKEALAEAAAVERRQPRRADHRQRQRLRQAGFAAGVGPVVEGFVEARQREGVAVVVGREEIVQQRTQAHAPDLRRSRHGEFAPHRIEAVEQQRELAERIRRQPAGLAIGGDVLPRWAVEADGIAEQQAAQAEQPGVRCGVAVYRQAEPRALFAVQRPAHIGRIQPQAQRGDIAFAERKARPQRRHVEQREHVAEGQPPVRQTEQQVERTQQRVEILLPAVGEAVRQAARVVAGVATEHRMHQRRIEIDVRHHDDDVARRQRGVGGKGGEQAVVEDFDFAQRTVRDLEAQRTIDRRIEPARSSDNLGLRVQFADVVLDLAQQGQFGSLCGRGGKMQVDARDVRLLVEHGDVVAPLPTPRHQQRVAVEVQQLVGQRRASVARDKFAPLAAQQLAPVDHVAPVVAARVMHTDQHLAPAREHVEHLDGLARQGRHAEHQHARRQAGRRCGIVATRGGSGEEGGMHFGAATVQAIRRRWRGDDDIGAEALPQRRLPEPVGVERLARAARVDQHRFAACPGVEPIGAIDLILVVEIGQFAGELPQAARRVALAALARRQKTRQRCKARIAAHLRQHAQQAPDQPLLVER